MGKGGNLHYGPPQNPSYIIHVFTDTSFIFIISFEFWSRMYRCSVLLLLLLVFEKDSNIFLALKKLFLELSLTHGIYTKN